MLFRFFFFLLSLTCFSFAEESENFFARFGSAPNDYIGRICINNRNQEINEATVLYVKAALDFYRTKKPVCVILELDTPGGELFSAKRISKELLAFDTDTSIPVVAYINNWAISAGALLAYSCRYIVITPDACMGAATPVSIGEEGMKEAPEKVNSLVRAEFANKAIHFNRNPSVARAMVDSDGVLVRRGGNIILLDAASQVEPTDVVLLPHGKLLTLTAKELLTYGIADSELTVPLTQGLTFPIRTYEMTTKEKIISFFTNPAVSSLLIFVAMVCFYIEMSAPGASIPGLIAGVALFFVIVGSLAQDAVTWFEPLCILGGALLITAECMFFPTFGALLFIGGALCLFGILGFLIPGFAEITFDQESFSLFRGYLIERLGYVSGAFLFAILSIIFFARFVSSKLLSRAGIVLQNTMPTPVETAVIQVGDETRTMSALRPAGKIFWKGSSLDAISRGSFVEEGVQVRVKEVRGNIIVVEVIT
jgi:membrane-bound serine protease (ClpP class)